MFILECAGVLIYMEMKYAAQEQHGLQLVVSSNIKILEYTENYSIMAISYIFGVEIFHNLVET